MSSIKNMIIEAEERAEILRGVQGKDIDTALCELAEAKDLMRWFCRRVQNGEVRSTRTYNKFKKFLEETS